MADPKYDLRLAQEAVRLGAIVFRRTAERDRLNLGYGDEEFAQLFCSLNVKDHFHKTMIYDLAELDCYRICWRHTTDARTFQDDLYIKFKLCVQGDGGTVVVASFHRDR